MHTHFEEISTRLFSPRLWRGFGAPQNLAPAGSSYQSPSGNAAFGFFDDFLSFHATTLEGPYKILKGASYTVEQIADAGAEKGILQLGTPGSTANGEAVLQWGRGLGAPFKLTGNDLVFECRLSVSATTISKWSIFAGLALADATNGAGITDKIFADTTGLLASTFSGAGFQHLSGESTAWDGAYKAASQTAQDGSTKTKLDTLHTAVAATYVKLGFRYRANPRTLEFYVNGAVPGGFITPAKLTATELDAATFPASTVFMAPVVGIKDVAGDTALNLKMDWWACAQLE